VSDDDYEGLGVSADETARQIASEMRAGMVTMLRIGATALQDPEDCGGVADECEWLFDRLMEGCQVLASLAIMLRGDGEDG
jgi:hypothetical protein